MSNRTRVAQRINHNHEEQSDRITFRGGTLIPEITRRALGSSAGLTVKRDLERYYAMLRRGLETISLSEAEARLLCEALRGWIFDIYSYELVWARIDDAIRSDALDRKYKVDGTALVEKVRGLMPGQKLSLLDAIEIALVHQVSPTALREIGLVRE